MTNDDLIRAAVDDILSLRPVVSVSASEDHIAATVSEIVQNRLGKRRPESYSTNAKKRLLVLQALRKYPNGLTLDQLSKITRLHRYGGLVQIVNRERGYSIYIDRWTKVCGQWVAVYALCDCPEDCPKPT